MNIEIIKQPLEAAKRVGFNKQLLAFLSQIRTYPPDHLHTIATHSPVGALCDITYAGLNDAELCSSFPIDEL